MKWLVWGKLDFENGLGGVEVYSRCVARELRKLGIHVLLSNDPAAPSMDRWDVIQTHGTALFKPHLSTQGIRLHTLHGSTFERMWACREFFWIGGYLAGFKERRGIRESDGVLSVHGNLHWANYSKRIGKPFLVCGNGWDSAPDVLDRTKISVKRPAVLFIGRGDDPMKNAPFFSELAARSRKEGEDWSWFAAPGTGFESDPIVKSTGRLESADVHRWIESVDAVVLPSLYEGLPLVVLESLAAGTPTLASTVGGIGSLPSALAGFTRFSDHHPSDWMRALREAVTLESNRDTRKSFNRGILDSWTDVAKRSLDFANMLIKQKRGAQ